MKRRRKSPYGKKAVEKLNAGGKRDRGRGSAQNAGQSRGLRGFRDPEQTRNPGGAQDSEAPRGGAGSRDRRPKDRRGPDRHLQDRDHRETRRTAEERSMLKVLAEKANRPLGSRELMRRSKITDRNKFYEALQNLERVGDVRVDQNHRVALVSETADVPATMVSLSAGFGFAKPEDGSEDVFIHGSNLKGAFLGDSVLLTDVRKQPKGLDGRVRRVVKRAQGAVTGTVRMDKEGIWVVPDGPLRYPLRIVKKDLHGAADGEKVTVLPRQDPRGEWTLAAVKTIFGSGNSAAVCAEAIIERCGIPTEFPEEVLRCAEKAAAQPITEGLLAGRTDLRGKTIFTIDGADAKDLDDAISVEKIRSGYKLGVHIADVSHYVKARSPVDREAFSRGTSVYFADRVIPMLPTDLSNGVCSLTAGTDKLAFSAFVYFDNEGKLIRYDFKKTVISSKVRGVYQEINALFGGTASKEILRKYKPVERALNHARTLANLLKQQAVNRGEMSLDSTELYFELNEKGVCVGIHPRKTGEAEQLIEHMMISANRAASMFAQKHQLPFLYRVHEKPQAENVAGLWALLDSMGIPCKELKGNRVTTKDFAAVLNRVAGTARETLVSQRILRTLEKAKYAAAELGHFGLALQDYSHFTSPIRRYPDLVIHRILSDQLSGLSSEEMKRRYGGFVEEAALQSSKTEVRAVSAERAAGDCYAAEYMQSFIGEAFPGMISGMTAKGLFIRIPCGVEGFVRLQDLPKNSFEFDGLITMRDRDQGKNLMVGDPFPVVVTSSEVAAGRVNFRPQTASETATGET